MKLLRFGPPGLERCALQLLDGRRIDASSAFSAYDESFFSSGGLENLAIWAKQHEGTAPAVPPDARLGSPIGRPSKIICIGLNYRDHAKESGMQAPTEPVVFFKSTTALAGPYDGLEIPHDSEKTDWEVELGVVIAKTARRVSESDAMDYVAGYVLHNDYSERAWQLEHCGQWVKGKSADTFAPLGPWLSTKDEIPNPHNLRLWLKVNGETKQDGNSSNLIFNIPFLISYLSRFMTLLPGDLISTGTPAGVGLGCKPPQYLREGDIIELGIDGLGSQRQLASAARD
jgi:2-keto-4-pentenoate hydratase/2-oxohepta-3-ene-1,7-dioic acid hydratase in catechol pathway